MTFTETIGHLEDNPFLFYLFIFFVFCFEMNQIVLGIQPDDKRNAKNFTSGLIVLGDLPDD